MAEFKKTVLKLNHRFDTRNRRHYLNGDTVVLHCHHYTSLYTQLAIDAGETELLASVAEDTFNKILVRYFEENKICDLEDRISLACQYYAVCGLGKMEIDSLGDFSGHVTLCRSHIDEGWIKKWGKFDKPVNYVTVGYIRGAFAAILGKSAKTFEVTETKSIVMGDKASQFKILAK